METRVEWQYWVIRHSLSLWYQILRSRVFARNLLGTQGAPKAHPRCTQGAALSRRNQYGYHHASFLCQTSFLLSTTYPHSRKNRFVARHTHALAHRPPHSFEHSLKQSGVSGRSRRRQNSSSMYVPGGAQHRARLESRASAIGDNY